MYVGEMLYRTGLVLVDQASIQSTSYLAIPNLGRRFIPILVQLGHLAQLEFYGAQRIENSELLKENLSLGYISSWMVAII